MALAQALGEDTFESRDVGALNEFAAGFAARDDLFGIVEDSRAVARDRCQHATGREI
jgi:hypothetical protein